MYRYIIESPHKSDECKHVLEQVTALGYITHYDWGCETGVHTGWVIIEAETEEEAMLSVPTLVRHEAHAVKLNKFSPEMFQSIHRPAI